MEELDTSGSFNAQVCQICNALLMKGDEGKEDGEGSRSELRMLFTFDATEGRTVVRRSNAWTMVTGGWISELVYLW